MAVYFDHRAQAPHPGQNTDIQWHKTAPLLAVASQSNSIGGCVNLYREEGEYVQDGELRKSRPASGLAWHPSKKILAVGWETGELTILNEQEHEKFEVPGCLHKSEITILHWTSNGSRLLSGDVTGVLVMWKADTRGRIQQQPLTQQNLQEQLTDVVMKPQAPVDPTTDIASLARAAVSGDENALDMFNWKKGKNNMRMTGAGMGSSEAVTFFIGGKSGSVYYLNENGVVVKQFTADGAVRKLLYYQEKNILVSVTTNMMLTQHSVSHDGETREILKEKWMDNIFTHWIMQSMAATMMPGPYGYRIYSINLTTLGTHQQVKLSGKSEHPDIIWAGKGILATCTNECVLRMWDLDKEENYILNLEVNPSYDRTESITCISFCQSKKLLAGGTDSGHIAVWKYSPALGAAGNKQEPEDRWKLQPPSDVSGPVVDLAWGSSQNLLAVNTVDEVYVLCEQLMSSHCCQQTGVVQTGPMQLSVDMFAINKHSDLKADIQIKGVYTTMESIAIWDSKKLVVYEIPADASMIKSAGTFSSSSALVCLFEQNVYTLEPGKVQVRNFQGTVKQLLSMMETEGEPVCMDVCSNFLIVGTSNGYIKMFDLSRREAKLCGSPKCVSEVMDNFGSIMSAKCNCSGSKVSIIGRYADGSMNPKIYIWDVDTDMVQFFNFDTGRSEQDEYISDTGDSETDITAAERGKNQAAKDIAGRFPTSHHWDAEEVKLLVCETKLKPVTESNNTAHNQSWNYSLTKPVIEEVIEEMVVSLFVTPESGVLIQDNFPLNPSHSALLAVQVPYFFFAKRADLVKQDSLSLCPSTNLLATPSLLVPDIDQHAMVSRRLMRDFVGLENTDKLVREAMMNFSYYLTIGNMDEAFKAIKLIKSESVWENMAKMCVKTRRLDVAAVCLGNMKHARGAKALREALKEPELDARVGELAMQLGLNDDAERLFKNCKRYDLLNNYYQCQGDWGKALETAEMYDRIHLRTTYHNYAKYLESKGDLNSAILNYEKSDTHRFEVPRMLVDDPAALESYIMKTKDKVLKKWWAQYMESTSEMETALQFYQAAHDILSLVRVYCYCNNTEKAAEICNETGDRAACYHLARQYEGNDQIREAVHFFTRAGAYGSAIRLCKDNGLEDQLINLAFLSRPEDMIEAARYYEFKPGSQDKAVTLYHKAGHFSKALDLAFETKQFAALQMVSEDLDDKTDPELLRKCADFFIDNGQFDRAVDLLAVGKKYWEALKICMEQHVLMTEDLVEKLTPPKEMAETDPEERIKILDGIAEVCMQQGQYHLATKKYTQAGNKGKAMKALLKSGDTEKIIFFAGVSRQKEIYVMAANYLQSLDWRKDPDIMKNIISFYTKGRAQDSLSSFYDACAQVEVDEYQNYDKAVGALSEAYKCLAKAKMSNQSLQEEKLADLKHRIGLVKKFVQARRTYEDDSEETIKTCQVLLQEPGIDASVRVGDIYGFMVEHYARKEKWKVAYECMEEMQLHVPKANMGYYINMKTIESIHQALNIPLKESGTPLNGFGGGQDDDEDGEEFVEEDVIDEIFDN